MTDEEQDIAFEGAEFEMTSRQDYVDMAYTAIDAALKVTTMTADDDERRERIISKAMDIIDNIICELYDELH